MIKTKNVINYAVIITLIIAVTYAIISLLYTKSELLKQKNESIELKEKNKQLNIKLKSYENDFSLLRKNHEVAKDSLLTEYKLDSLVTSISRIDLDSVILYIKRISESEFQSLSESNNIRYEDLHFKETKECINKDAWRENDSTFLVRLESSKLDTIHSYMRDGSDFETYKYQGFVKPINSYLFTGHYNDSWDLLIVNKDTGERTYLEHHLVVSPNKELAVTYAWDGWAFYSGGFKFYKLEHGQLKLEIDYYPPEYIYEEKGYYWSFRDITIVSEEEFVFVAEFLFIKGGMYRTYAKLNIEKTTTNK